jgi:hypothetical protein
LHRIRFAVLSAATIVAALGLAGCGNESRPAPPPPAATTPSTIAQPPPPAPLPPPDALTAVLSKLADPAVRGEEKVGLVEHGTADDAAALNKFGKALQDGGFTPLTFEASDLVWSQADPGNVVATITVRTANRQSGGEFSFPMEFNPLRNGWQLTRQTADLLLQLGQPPTPTPTP